jgi:hypothetical protein
VSRFSGTNLATVLFSTEGIHPMTQLESNNAHAQFIYEHPASGIVQEWTNDRSLCIFAITNSRPETIDAWAYCVKQTIFRWDAKQPCYLLHDLRKAGAFTFNSQLQLRFADLYRYRPALARFVAVVLPKNSDMCLLAQLSVRVRELTAPSMSAAHWNIFSSRLEALSWLLKLRLEQGELSGAAYY